jgi:hypothetical protein
MQNLRFEVRNLGLLEHFDMNVYWTFAGFFKDTLTVFVLLKPFLEVFDYLQISKIVFVIQFFVPIKFSRVFEK